MSTGGPEKRDSRALEPDLITDAQERAEAEARNGLRQFDAGIAAVRTALDRGGEFRLRPSLILSLHREALKGISLYAGNYRPGGVEIGGSKHEPPGAHLVPELIEEMCDYVNAHWDATALHLAAYVMWRLNWVHPFADGNGRTSRITSYVVLSTRMKAELIGTPTIPDQIVDNRKPYFEALDAADAAWIDGRLDLSKMEQLLGALLANQLTQFFEQAGGQVPG